MKNILFINLVYSYDNNLNYKYVLQYRISYDKGKIQDVESANGENFTYINTFTLNYGTHAWLINEAKRKVLSFVNKTEEDFLSICINDINL